MHNIKGPIMPVFPNPGDIRLDHLVKVVSAEFLHCKVIFFPFSIYKYLGRDTLKVYKYPVSPKTF